MVKMYLVGLLLALASLAACSKKEPPKTAEQQKVERDAAAKTTRENPVWGEQVKALDKAKAISEKIEKSTEEKLKEVN